MAALRHLIAILIAAYALISAVPIAMLLAVEAGVVGAARLEAMPAWIARIMALDLQQIAIWGASLVAYLAAARALVRRSANAVWLHALAIGLDLFNWPLGAAGTFYTAAFDPGRLTGDYMLLAVHFLCLALVMLLARGWGRARAAA